MFPFLYLPNEPVYFLGFLPPLSVHADPDPGGISFCGSGSETFAFSMRPQIICYPLKMSIPNVITNAMKMFKTYFQVEKTVFSSTCEIRIKLTRVVVDINVQQNFAKFKSVN